LNYRPSFLHFFTSLWSVCFLHHLQYFFNSIHGFYTADL